MTVLCAEGVTTIFVTGLPEDIQEREFQNMFLFCSGFDQAILRCKLDQDLKEALPALVACKKRQPIGFVTFTSHKSAIEACDFLSGKIVDCSQGCVLAASLAKKTITLDKDPLQVNEPSSFNPFDFDDSLYRKSRASSNLTSSSGWSWASSNANSPFSSPSTKPLAESNTEEKSTYFEDFEKAMNGGLDALPKDIQHFAEMTISRSGNGDINTNVAFTGGGSLEQFIMPVENPPCNTLYVGNLPPNSSEQELRDLFIKCHGYKRLSFRIKENGPMCFVEFQDILCSTAAMHQLQGTMLKASKKGGIRLSYSKNPLGVRSLPCVGSRSRS